MAHNIGPAMSIVELFLQLRWLAICVGENSFTEHALTLLQIASFSDANEIKTNVFSSEFHFLRPDGG